MRRVFICWQLPHAQGMSYGNSVATVKDLTESSIRQLVNELSEEIKSVNKTVVYQQDVLIVILFLMETE